MEEQTSRIVKLVKGKSLHKKRLYLQSLELFKQFKEVLKEVGEELKGNISEYSDVIEVTVKEVGDFEAHICVGGDTLVFLMHSNVFTFDPSNPMHKTGYVSDDNKRAYFSMIMVFNFLSDSFRFNRMDDSGYLISRLFVNFEGHYFAEGKKELGILFNDLLSSQLDRKEMERYIKALIIHALEFDLYTPPYESMREINLAQLLAVSNAMKVRMAKRLGYRFSMDNDED